MRKYTIIRNDGGAPIPEDEPCLVIRGQDKVATDMINAYIMHYKHRAPNPDAETIEALRALKAEIEAWPKKKWAGE